MRITRSAPRLARVSTRTRRSILRRRRWDWGVSYRVFCSRTRSRGMGRRFFILRRISGRLVMRSLISISDFVFSRWGMRIV